MFNGDGAEHTIKSSFGGCPVALDIIRISHTIYKLFGTMIYSFIGK